MHRVMSLAIAALIITSHAGYAEASDALPPGVQALLAPQDTVLAYREGNPLGPDAQGAAMIVRHGSTDPSKGNSCDLWVVRATDSSYVITARNGQVVDCRYNEAARNAGRMELARNLTVTPNSITYFNELPRGGTTYGFAWDSTKRTWHLQHVEATWVENGETGVVVYRSVIAYPATLPWLAFDAFSPKTVANMVRTHRTVVEDPAGSKGTEQGKTPALRPSYDRCLEASGGVTIAVNNCIGNEYDFQDERLNAAYKALRATMTDVQRKSLRDDERAWIADRDKGCAPPADGGTANMLGANECRMNRTADRAAELEAQRNHP